MKWEKDAKTSTDAIGTSFDSMLKKIVAGFSAAKIGQMLLNLGKDAVQAASDLAEVQNVVDVTFGDAGAAKIEAWAKKAGEQFGLTETQAKRFTSTLGAMMKSAGMSGDEITEMSTDLAGLAADMASFYNLDFDTAFQKIRSGISGETEPLKQLGINMSEANLNAFALQKGLEKTFAQMTQGEKTILRYQYLMQATSDAQGDFARTSDGFANATRMLETNIESLKAKLGTVLLPVINEVVGAINGMLEAMTGEHDTTVLDEFAAIDLKTQEKIAAIQETAENARTLTGVLENIEEQAGKNKKAASEMLDDVPDGNDGNLKELAGNLAGIEGVAEGAQAAIEGITEPTDAAAESNALWLETCEELVRTIPGLSEIIDTQTGEIEGGTQAVYDYIDAWEKAQTGVVLKAAHEQKRGVLESKFNELPGLELDKAVADYRVREQMKQLDAMRQELGISGNGYGMVVHADEYAGAVMSDAEKQWNEQILTLAELQKAQKEAAEAYQVQKDAYDEAVVAWEAEGEAIAATYDEAIEAADAWTIAQQEAATEALSAFDEALQAVEDYYNKVKEETAAQVGNTLTGFEGIKTAAQQYKEAANAAEEYSKKLKEARAEGKNALTDLEIETTANAKNNQITMQGMLQNLEDQLAYIEEYQQNLAIARESGISDEILGMLSDGSNESALYLNAIAEAAKTGNEEDIKRLNDMWIEVNKGKESFVDTLTQQKLEVDKTYDEMVKKAEEAAAALDVSQQAGESTGKNVQAMIDAIRNHVPGIAEQVDAVLAQLNRLNEWGVTIDYGFGASTVIKPGARGSGGPPIASLAVGMDWIPFDGFLATLHQGEAVLTAEENRVWQAFKNGQRGVDYDTLGGVMRENVKAGGNVYLDGRVVGSVISQMQGNQYRTMQRSGWQQ